ncbi:type I-E CRISPR-associated protein Cas7/Cse4/CasC [Breoghania sp.]|uniref:type I-E CRISPR-associated protein Cas7/Cse4/CasC n=1 Tax=Breoghania sp. TaxID=2065378 RepID=UPI0029CA2F81|nr:type I-E CRISPR-associated protein Cas7/Cse4/CasC [Breoghania sp.]
MNRFLQLHVLTAYPPSNPNRDDLGRPKSAIIGGVQRMRISSQAIKRAMRQSPAFVEALTDSLGKRTQRLGEVVRAHLVEKGADEKTAVEIARDIAAVFGKLKGDKDGHPTYIEQLAFISPDERAAALSFADKMLSGEKLPGEKELVKMLLNTADGAVDIAMFGRMLAANPDYNRDAAVQVAHAFTTNRVTIEDDYYTAVDDLKQPSEDAGAGFIGEAGFGAGIFYVYVCVDRRLLVENLAGDGALAARGIEALVRAAAISSPSGKKNAFANHVRAEFVLAELGDGQPRTLASAFTRPVSGADQMVASVDALTGMREAFALSYGKDWTDERLLQVGNPDGVTLDDLASFAASGVADAAA